MDFLSPTSLSEALECRAENPRALPLAGGTDVLVELNFDRRRPDAIVDLTRVEELASWNRDDGVIRLGPGVTYARLMKELPGALPGLVQACRTVGSPQIRNRGTVGGNLGTASPAGDALPPLMATGAEIELTSVRGTRLLPLVDFLVGPKHNALEPDELITAIVLPVATGPQQFSKIGTRNAMVIAVAAFSLSIDPRARRVGTGIGSAGPVILSAGEAETFISSALEEEGLWESRGSIPGPALERFGELVGAAARPIDDVRGSASYRRHALAVMARRSLAWAWSEYMAGD